MKRLFFKSHSMETTFATEANSLRLELAKSVCAIYATESSLYMTSGIMDIYKNSNIELESCILQVVIVIHIQFCNEFF